MFLIFKHQVFTRRCDDGRLHVLELVRTGVGKPHAGRISYGRQRCEVFELKLVLARDNALQFRRRALDGHSLPCLVPFLFPHIERLAVQFVESRLGHGHGAGIAGEKEVNVVHVARTVRQINTGKMTTRAEVGQVLGVDADQFEREMLATGGEPEIAAACADLLVDMPFDRRLNVSGDDLGNRQCLAILFAAAGKQDASA